MSWMSFLHGLSSLTPTIMREQLGAAMQTSGHISFTWSEVSTTGPRMQARLLTTKTPLPSRSSSILGGTEQPASSSTDLWRNRSLQWRFQERCSGGGARSSSALRGPTGYVSQVQYGNHPKIKIPICLIYINIFLEQYNSRFEGLYFWS